jgi:hypothetical protein
MSPEALSFMPKFFVIGGLILILSGAAQWFIRPRRENETPAQMLGSRATLKMIIFVSVGIFFTLLGAGAIPFPHFR